LVILLVIRLIGISTLRGVPVRHFYILAIFCLALLGACSDSESPRHDDQLHNNGLADAGQDAGDATPNDDAAQADAGPDGCVLQGDCAGTTICVAGQCVESPECEGLDDWKTCVEEFEALGPGLARRAVCDAETNHCRASCLLDQHCAAGQICTDGGHCIEFTGEITGEAPGGQAREALEAGVANILMTFPIGLSQGGYGSRMATNDGRYVESLAATDGQMHGLYARAFVLDNGERQLMFIRLPVVFPTMALHEAVARKLQELTGRDWRDSLVLTATHTHSGPTRFWHLPDDALISLGSFGTDEFSQQVFDWMLESTFAAAKAALDDLSPARFGWTIVEGFDTDDAIASDRWGATPAFDDNRMLIFRIDDADGNPRAVLVSFGAHGTVHTKSYFTGDVPAGVERGLEKALGQEYDRFVPVMYLNGNGGTMSPRGDRWGHNGSERFEALGRELAQRAMPAIRDMTTETDIELAGLTHRFPITYETVGYEPHEWEAGSVWDGSANDVFDFGALNCLGSSEDGDPATFFAPPITQGCLPVHYLNFHRPVSLFARSQITALKIDGLTIISLPGEASMGLGWQVAREARDRFGVDPLKSWVMGYAQDHQFYLTPTNLRGEAPVYPGSSTPRALDEYPDFAFSWLQGGYEASLSVWGWKFGDFMLERAMEAVGRLTGSPVEFAFGPTLPAQFSRVEEPAFLVESSDPELVGTVVEEPPETVARFEPIEFAWIGGDPGAEMPQAPRVVLEKKVGGSFQPAETLSRRPYDNRESVMFTRVRKNGDAWEWVVYWEEIQNFELGEYRFRVEGHYRNAAGERQSYETTSRSFELVASDQLVVTVAPQNPMPTIAGTLGYPPGAALSFAPTPEDPGRLSGNFRMRHPRVPLGQSAPLMTGEDIAAEGITVTVSKAGVEVMSFSGEEIALTTAPETVNGRDGVPVTRFVTQPPDLPMAPGTYDIKVTVTDAWGNTGVAATTATVP
jgi:hypothetical protein